MTNGEAKEAMARHCDFALLDDWFIITGGPHDLPNRTAVRRLLILDCAAEAVRIEDCQLGDERLGLLTLIEVSRRCDAFA